MTNLHDMIVPVWEKQNLTIEEAAAYSNIGKSKLYELTKEKNCPFVLRVGNKILIKRLNFDKYINSAQII